jgi:hypothetical protein
MADIRCPNCGRDNPDLLDVCQFCQTPLKPESVLRIGEKPTKKNTGELEPILPDWLRDVRQQARDAAEEEAAQADVEPKPRNDEPPDLLAGLASQSGSGEEEGVPDWLASLNPTPKSTPTVASPEASADESGSDFFAQFNQSKPMSEPVEEPSQNTDDDTPAWMSNMREQASAPVQKDELSEWLTQASERPEEKAEPGGEHSDMGWGSPFDLPSASEAVPSPREEEDLSWLHNLEAASKQTGELETPRQEMDWKSDFEVPSTPSGTPAAQDDLSWLDRLGGIDEPSKPVAEQPAAPQKQEDLSWLEKFDGISAPAPQPPEEPSWLSNFGTPAKPPPVDAAPNQPIPAQPFVSGEDLDWLNKLGGESEAEKPVAPFTEETAADLDWLNQLGGKPEELAVPPFTDVASELDKVPPRQTAPLNKDALKEPEPEPDWLRSATEVPSMPAPGDLSMDWFSGTGQTTRDKTPPPSPPAAPFESDIFSPSSEPASLSNEDVDSLFSVEMPDWLSRSEPEAQAPVSGQPTAAPLEGDESLAPVDLPSWVQAMRPVEAVISETASSVVDQPAETEGPLAGLHGVLPIAPIGSSRRPKPVSLTLQAPPEQQASAVLLEQILGSETSPRALVTSTVVATQQWLRWVLSGLFLLVLGASILLRSQLMPIHTGLPEEAGGLSSAVIGIPANAKALVVIDYEPALAGEMEAISGPLLDQITLLSQPNLSFISTSPSGAMLVERLIANTQINQSGIQYQNLGYLPGGPAGVLGFMEAPGEIVPRVDVTSFSQYAALVVLTDHAESGRVWVEQLQNRRAADPSLNNQPLLMVASAQAGPLLQPYVSSGQITGMISGLSDAARYELVNNGRPGIVRSYWDTFGIGLMMSVAVIILGSLWSVFTGMRARRANAEQG